MSEIVVNGHTHLYEIAEPKFKARELLKIMKKAGVDSCVVFCDKRRKNFKIEQLVKHYPQHFIPFARLLPQKRALEELTFLVKKGFRGLKLHPIVDEFNPLDEVSVQLVKRAGELNIPILFHTGAIVYAGKKRNTNPLQIGKLASQCRKVKIIMAHAGGKSWRDALEVLLKCDNVRVDTAPLYSGMIKEIFPKLIKKIGVERIIFGSDYPFNSPQKVLQEINSLNIKSKDKEKIRGINFQTLLKG